MDELLKKLLAAEVLTEDTRNELETAFKGQLSEAVKEAQAQAHVTVTAELNEQWITERETLIEALDSKVTEALGEELKELKEDIERFRDLEAEFAEKLVEAKSEMAVTVKSDVGQLIEKLDAFLEVRLTTELAELREDVALVKKNEFGKSVFEAFVAEYKKHYANDDSVEGKLNESELRLNNTLAALEVAEKKAAKLERSIKLEKVLAPLSGRTKEVMEAILKSVDTPLLEDAYKTYVGRVLKETSQKDATTSEQETTVLAEGETKTVLTGVVKSGDNKDQIAESLALDIEVKASPTSISDADRQRLRRAAGLS